MPIIEKLGLKEALDIFPPAAPCTCHSGKLGTDKENYNIHVVTHKCCKTHNVDHLGTVAASLSTWLAIDRLKVLILLKLPVFALVQCNALVQKFVCENHL